jgi:hypothetical protein
MDIIIDTTAPEYLTVEDIARLAQVSRTVAYEIAHEIGITRLARNAIRVESTAFRAYMKSRTSAPKRPKSVAKLKRTVETLAEQIKELES